MKKSNFKSFVNALIKSNKAEKKEKKEWMEKISNLPFTTQVRSENGASYSVSVNSAHVTKNGITTELFNDEITLSTNQGEGEQTKKSYASVSFPQNNESMPEFLTGGNANVKNIYEPYLIAIEGDKKEFKIKSAKGLFATIEIDFRRDCNFNCFEIYFGEAGRKETINQNGVKSRPHLTIFPDGNNKYFRFVNYKCKIESKLGYDVNEKKIFPIELTVFFEDYSEQLSMSFVFIKEINTVELIDAKFI